MQRTDKQDVYTRIVWRSKLWPSIPLPITG